MYYISAHAVTEHRDYISLQSSDRILTSYYHMIAVYWIDYVMHRVNEV